MIVVADTSPLNYLVRIELVEVLRKLYGSVVIPPEVRDELLAKDSPAIVRNRALALANEYQSALLLIDERAGTLVARGIGLAATGTLGVLDEAARRRLISLPDAIRRLKKTSFRYPQAIVARLLAEDAAR